MKRKLQTLGIAVLVPVAAFMFSACRSVPECVSEIESKSACMTVMEPGEAGGAFVETRQQTAVVTGIDKASRTVTMVTPEGKAVVFKAGPEVINFDQIKVGDQVRAVLAEQFVVFARKAGEPAGDGAAAVLVRAPQGEKPGVMVSASEEVTAKVISIDPKERKASLRFPNGTGKTFKVREDVDLTKYAAGDEVVFRITEAVAVSVEKP